MAVTLPEDHDRVAFVKPSADLERDFWVMCDEYSLAGEGYEPSVFFPDGRNFAAYLRQLDRFSRGTGRLPSHVPMSVYWLVRDGERILATCYLRWRLTPSLQIEGGHIGYKVRPSERRKGYGCWICALALETFRQRGYQRVLITCNTDNQASARIIVKNGGRFDGESPSPHSGKPVSRFWVTLSR